MFGDILHVDIPMLHPYREEMFGPSFHTFSFGGHLHFEAYVQYREYAGFVRSMRVTDSLAPRGWVLRVTDGPYKEEAWSHSLLLYNTAKVSVLCAYT